MLPIHYAKSVHPHKTVFIACRNMRKMHNIAVHARSLPRSRTCTALFLSDLHSGKQGHWIFCVGLRFMRYAILGTTCSRPRAPFEIDLNPKAIEFGSARQGKVRHAKLLVEGRKYCCGTSRIGTKLQGNLHFGARFRQRFGGCFGRYRGDEKFPLCIKASLPELQVTVWIHSGHLAKQSTSNQFTSSSSCTPSERVHSRNSWRSGTASDDPQLRR